MNLPLSIAWRYLKRPTDALVSAVGLVSVLGLVIGVMALVISMALMTGYRKDLQTKLLAGNAEVFVYSIGGPMTDANQTLGAMKLSVRAEGGHYTFVEATTDQMGESRMDRNVKRFFVQLHRTEDPTHTLQASY